ncbi:MAG: diguanylate cyclase [Acidobacteria bacterium]|nr:diguanylate cyclase [Acidobacteriota bacterium]
MLLTASLALALDPSALFDDYTFRRWTRDDGLPQNSVQALVQDRTGYIWIATQEGLARFDGVRFVIFDRHTTPALPANNVLSLALGDQDVIWIGFRNGGLSRLINGQTIERFGAGAGIPNAFVRTLLMDHDGNLWAGTRGGGLVVCPAGTSPPTFRPVPTLEEARILDLFEDRSGAIWIATEGEGLLRMHGGQIRRFQAADGLKSNTVWRVLQTSDGTLWAATYGGGLARLQGRSFVTLTTREGLPGNRVTSLLEDHDGNLWVGMAGAGLARIRHGRVTAVATKNPLATATVLSLMEDREHNLWVGTESQGLMRLGDSLFTTLDVDDGLASPMARCILEARDGSLWVGTSSGGLQHFIQKEGRMVLAPVQPRISATDVFSLYEEPGGAVWVGTYEQGVFRLERGKIQRWTSRDGLPANTVWALEGDGARGVWAGTYGGGLAHITRRGITTYGPAQGLTSKLIRVIRRTRNGDLWIGTSGGGVCVFRDGKIIPNPGTGQIARTTVMDIYEDADGALWFGTNGGGLCRLSNGSLGCLTMSDGLLDDVAFRILEDARGRFWMSCNHGIYRVARANLNAVLNGRRTQIRCQVFGRTDGMPTSECNGGSQPSGWRAHDGKLWFPTPEGFVAVDAESAPREAPPATVVVEALRADGQTIPLSTAIALAPGTRSIEIDYTALTFRAPEKVRFQYRLSGLGENWIDAGSRRTAYFNHLEPSSYAFIVRARNSLGRWSAPSSPFTFSIEPYFYQRLPVQLTAVFILLLGLSALIAFRVHEHHRRESELKEKVRVATLQLQMAHKALEEANAKLKDLSLHDPLTGVPNRRSFDQTIALLWQQSLRTGAPLALLMIDIDKFKDYNDHSGHLAGDACLRQVATILRTTLRRGTDIIARYGGEEFAVLLPGNGIEMACQLAGELRVAVESARISHPTSGHGGVLTISIGVAAMVATPDTKPSDLIAAADQALYVAKANGRNRLEFTPAAPR